MKGCRIVIDGEKNVTCADFETPLQLQNDELLVKVHFSLISPGTELAPYVNLGVKRVMYPGYTAVGQVLQTGNMADEGMIGKMVLLFPEKTDSKGCHASLKVFRTGGLALEVPADLDPARACFARMVNIALTPYCNASPKTMGSVLVAGLGMVGNMVSQVGRIRGFYTVGADPDAARRSRAVEAGIDAAINPNDDDLLARIDALTEGRGVDLAVNATGHSAPFMPLLQATVDGGEISTLGGARQGWEMDTRAIFSEIHSRHLNVRGGWEMQLPLRSASASLVASTEANLRNAFRWLKTGAVNLDPVWTHTILPEQFKEAYDALVEKDENYLGVVVDWTRCD